MAQEASRMALLKRSCYLGLSVQEPRYNNPSITPVSASLPYPE